jgi:hypothetical protein
LGRCTAGEHLAADAQADSPLAKARRRSSADATVDLDHVAQAGERLAQK